MPVCQQIPSPEVQLLRQRHIFGAGSAMGNCGCAVTAKFWNKLPTGDTMGAFGFLLNTHKWKNINIRHPAIYAGRDTAHSDTRDLKKG